VLRNRLEVTARGSARVAVERAINREAGRNMMVETENDKRKGELETRVVGFWSQKRVSSECCWDISNRKVAGIAEGARAPSLQGVPVDQ
jgi:hypothetical protein